MLVRLCFPLMSVRLCSLELCYDSVLDFWGLVGFSPLDFSVDVANMLDCFVLSECGWEKYCVEA